MNPRQVPGDAVSSGNRVATGNRQGPVASSGGVTPDRGVAISLFSGAGGLDLGAEAAGFTVRAAVEHNHDAADTMEKNFPHLNSPVIRRSILDVSSAEILDAAGLGQSQRPELLVGGPPCTPFSKSGFWLEWKRAGLDPTRRCCRRTRQCCARPGRGTSCWRTSTR